MESTQQSKKILKINGSKNKDHYEYEINREFETVRQFLKYVCKRLNLKYPSHKAKIYTKDGLEIFDQDIQFALQEDILYYDPRDKYEILEKLGEGGYGKVMKGKHKETKKEVAIKFMEITELLAQANTIEEIFRESKALKMLDHRNIIKLHHAFVHKQDIVLIMEYASGGELRHYVVGKGHLQEVEARTFIQQICTAIAVCHQKGIIHRDLKLENVLFSSSDNKQIKVVDFGIAGMCKNNDKEVTDAGTLRYMPPEILSGDIKLADKPADIWSIGVILYCMIFGTHPFKGESKSDLIKAIISQQLDFPKTHFISEALRDLLNRLLDKSPETRIDLSDVLVQKSEEELDVMIEESKQEYEEKQKQIAERKAKKEELKFNQYQKMASNIGSNQVKRGSMLVQYEAKKPLMKIGSYKARHSNGADYAPIGGINPIGAHPGSAEKKHAQSFFEQKKKEGRPKPPASKQSFK